MRGAENVNINIIKKPSLIRAGMIYALQEKFGEQEIKAYSHHDYTTLYNENNNVDVVIIDLDTDINVLTMIKYFTNENKKIIVCTSSFDNPSLIDLFKLNLDGYFTNGMEKDELQSGVVAVISGKKYLHESLVPILLEDYIRRIQKKPNKPSELLTKREWEVLELLIKGCKNKRISEILFISEKTVKNHVSSLLKKMDVPDRTNAILTALRNEWLFI